MGRQEQDQQPKAAEAADRRREADAGLEKVESAYRAAAKRLYGQEGAVEIDADARVSVTLSKAGEGAYVAAWVWVDGREVESPEGKGLPACEACGERAGWVISSSAPVYVTVDASGAVSRVRVNDEALELEFGGGWNRYGGRSPVMCKACDRLAPEEVAGRVRAAATAADEWPSWELGA